MTKVKRELEEQYDGVVDPPNVSTVKSKDIDIIKQPAKKKKPTKIASTSVTPVVKSEAVEGDDKPGTSTNSNVQQVDVKCFDTTPTVDLSIVKKPKKKPAKKSPQPSNSDTDCETQPKKFKKPSSKRSISDSRESSDGGETAKPPKKKKKNDKVEKEGLEGDKDEEEEEEGSRTSTDLETTDLDNFSIFELKEENKLETFPHNDLIDIVIDEISLEGLDGITTEALWTRISDAILEALPFPRHFQALMWNIVHRIDRIRFYELPEPRPKLIVFNRYKYFDWESGHIIEPDEYPLDIYPFVPISSDKSIASDTFGSCATFDSRLDVTQDVRGMTLDDVELKYGSKLVMVADQALRTKALMSENANPTIKLTNLQYCILERIGRSRKLGEVTAGGKSLMDFGDSKSLFYLRKQLFKNNLITKQPFCIRNKNSLNATGLLFHLRRFYSEHKSKKQVIIEQVVDILKRKPKFRMEYIELKKVVGFEAWSKGGLQKLLKSSDFRQFVSTDVMVPYRTMYPNATQSEWKSKNTSKEKKLRVLELINPTVNVSAAFRDDEQKDDSSDDEPVGECPFNISVFNYTYDLIFEAGSEGLSLKQLQRKIGLDFYLARSILSNMVKRNLVDTINVDVGRQHIMKYFAPCFNSKEFCKKYQEDKETTDLSEPAYQTCDEETLDFISDILKIDKHYLKSENAITSDVEPYAPEDPFKGQYDFIREFRRNNRMEKFRASEKSTYRADNLSQVVIQEDVAVTESASVKPEVGPPVAMANSKDSKEKYEEILKNSHSCYEMHLSVSGKRIEPLKLNLATTSVFGEICKKILTERSESSYEQSYETQYAAKEHNKTERNLKVLHSNLYKKLEHPRLLGSAEKAFPIVQNYFFLKCSTSYKKLLDQFKRVVEDMLCKRKDGILEFPVDATSEDEFYTNEEPADDWSIQVALGDVTTTEQRFKNAYQDDAYKSILLEDFEKIDFQIRPEIWQDGLTDVVASDGFVPGKDPLPLEVELVSHSDDAAISEFIQKESSEDLARKVAQIGKMNCFMGPRPIIYDHSIDEDDIETIIVVSTPPEKYAEVGTGYKNKMMSLRTLSRANFIIDTVSKEKMISDLTKLTNMLKQVEKQSNCSGTIDRKTLERLLAKLVQEGYIKMVKLILKYNNITRFKNMLCMPQVDVNTVVQSTIEQMRMSFFIYAKRKANEDTKTDEAAVESAACAQVRVPLDEDVEKDCVDSLTEMYALISAARKPSKYKYSRTIGRQYGYVPKFAKIKILHEVVFYLIYGYDGTPIDRDKVPNILGNFHVKVDDFLMAELSTLYKKELSWKMFMPPLPKHKNWPGGWALVCDILLRLPLSIFIKIFNISYCIPALVPYLNDPVRKHLLIKNIPAEIRNACLFNRKYIFSIHDVFCYLCYIGLLQFGAQKLRDKDQQFIYLNRKAVLYDTTSSEPGYHHISDREYPRVNFTFNTEADVEDYWHKVWHFSMNTKLGQRYSQLNKTITLQEIHGKSSMVQSMLPKTPQTALEADVGYIPGDRLGACCFDSSTWVHVKRNWLWSSGVKKNRKMELPPGMQVTGMRRKHLEQVKVKPIKYKDVQNEILKKKSTKLVKSEAGDGDVKRLSAKTQNVSKRKLPFMRKVLRRPQINRRKIVVSDEIDAKIRIKMGKCRSVWTEEEDTNLLLCKAASNYLCPNMKRRTVPYTAIRDVMHRLCPTHRKKPSLAYNRRYMKITKKDATKQRKHSVDTDKYVQIYFSKFRDKVNQENLISDEELSIAFIYLTSYNVQNYKRSYKNQQKMLKELGYIDFLTKENIFKCNQQTSVDEDILYHEPANDDDFKIDLIKSAVHSSLGWKADGVELPLLLYRIYQNFSNDLLRSAIISLREQQMISGKKTHTKHLNTKEGINLGGSLIHSSFLYSFKQITKYPEFIFPESHHFLLAARKYKEHKKDIIVEQFEQSHGIALSEIATDVAVNIAFKISDENLVLDPSITDHSELFQELAVRCKFMLCRRSAQENPADENETESTLVDLLPGKESTEHLEKVIESIFEKYKNKRLKNQIQEDPENGGLSTEAGDAEMQSEASTSDVRKVSTEEIKSTEKIQPECNESQTINSEIATKGDTKPHVNVDELRAETDNTSSKPAPIENPVPVDEDRCTGLVTEKDGERRTLLELSTHLENRQAGDETQKSTTISDLAYLLTKGLFPELDDDEQRIDKLSRHFLITFPTPSISFASDMENQPWYKEILQDYLSKGDKLMKKVYGDAIVRNLVPAKEEIFNELKNIGAEEGDVTVANSIIEFVRSKDKYGATSQELQANFSTKTAKLNLCTILSTLIKTNIIIRVGICSIAFVHFDYSNDWTIHLDDQKNVSEDEIVTFGFKLKLMPWILIDGKINDRVFVNWLSIILSHCLSYPVVVVSAVAKRFNFLKPVDVFYLLECLQELACLRLFTYTQSEEVSLFSSVSYRESREANMLDDFNLIYVKTDHKATMRMGAFWNRNKVDGWTPFDDKI